MNKNEAKELKSLKEMTQEEIKEECEICQCKLLKVVTKAKTNRPSTTYFTATVVLDPGIAEAKIRLEQAEFINIIKSTVLKDVAPNERNARLESAITANKEITVMVAVRFSKGEKLNPDTKETRPFYLAEVMFNKNVRKSVFLSDLDADNIGDDIEFILRKGSLNIDEEANIVPSFFEM